MAKGVAFTFYVSLPSQADTKLMQVNPTLAAGDVKYSDTPNAGALTNLATLPDVYPAGGQQVRVQVSAAEANIEPLMIFFKDAAGTQWCDVTAIVYPSQIPPVDAIAATLADKTGFSLSAAGILAIWNQLTADVGIVTASFAKLIIDNLNATVGSRSTYAGTDTPGTTTILADYARRSDTLAADLTKIKGTGLTDTIGQVAAAFSKFFDKAAPTGTVNSLPDAVAGTAAGLALKSDITAISNPTVSVSSAQAANVFEGSLAIEAGYTFEQSVTSTTTENLATAAKIYFALKKRGAADTASMVYIEKTAGLTRIKGAAYAYPTDGTLTVSGSAGAWVITLGLNLRGTLALLGVNDNQFTGAVKAILAGATEAIPVWEDAGNYGNGNCSVIDGLIEAIT